MRKQIALLATLLLVSCASVQTGTNSNVTIRHGTMAPFEDVQAQATAYCRQRGWKAATFRSKYDANYSVFDCQQ